MVDLALGLFSFFNWTSVGLYGSRGCYFKKTGRYIIRHKEDFRSLMCTSEVGMDWQWETQIDLSLNPKDGVL